MTQWVVYEVREDHDVEVGFTFDSKTDACAWAQKHCRVEWYVMRRCV